MVVRQHAVSARLALLHHLAFIEHADGVGSTNCGEAVRDDHALPQRKWRVTTYAELVAVGNRSGARQCEPALAI